MKERNRIKNRDNEEINKEECKEGVKIKKNMVRGKLSLDICTTTKTSKRTDRSEDSRPWYHTKARGQFHAPAIFTSGKFRT